VAVVPLVAAAGVEVVVSAGLAPNKLGAAAAGFASLAALSVALVLFRPPKRLGADEAGAADVVDAGDLAGSSFFWPRLPNRLGALPVEAGVSAGLLRLPKRDGAADVCGLEASFAGACVEGVAEGCPSEKVGLAGCEVSAGLF